MSQCSPTKTPEKECLAQFGVGLIFGGVFLLLFFLMEKEEVYGNEA